MWDPLPPMASARSAFAATTIDGKLYAIGGFGSWPLMNDWAAQKTAEVFDPNIGLWTPLPSMDTGRSRLGAAAMDGKIYVIGGADTDHAPLATGEVFDPNTGVWTPLPLMLSARMNLAAAEVDGKLYAIGGHKLYAIGGHDRHLVTLSTAEVFDPNVGVWVSLPPMASARSSMSAVAMDGKLYVVGGANNDGFWATTEVYDPNTGIWATSPPIPLPCSDFTLVAMKGGFRPQAV